MFCPTCGLENAKGQKFCRRCGTNLLALDLARELLSETTTGQTSPRLDPHSLLKYVTLISTLGILIVTSAVLVLGLAQYNTQEWQHGPPLAAFVAIFGYGIIGLVCWRILRLLELSQTEGPALTRPAAFPPATQQTSVKDGTTNRQLNEARTYHSITESETLQFQGERRSSQE